MKKNKPTSFVVWLLTTLLVVMFCNCNRIDDPIVETITIIKDTISVSTKNVKNISITSANSGGIVLNPTILPITAKGLCWSKKPNPTIALETKTVVTSTFDNFDSVITGLEENTSYYVRAYATNDRGTVYGEEINFTTTIYTKLFTDGAGVSDIEGNTYKSVIINGKEWMAENLRTTKYNNGDVIDSVDGIWTPTEIENFKTYGPYYNWLAVNDSRKICPSGWHIPSKDEWLALRNFLDSDATDILNVAGIKLKSSGVIEDKSGLWMKNPNSTGATNESGFTALPNGAYDFEKAKYFSTPGIDNTMWTSTVEAAGVSIYMAYLTGYNDNFYIQSASIGNKKPDDKTTPIVSRLGLSCRCLKN